MTISPSTTDSGSTTQSDDRPLAAPKTASLATSSNDISPVHSEGPTPTVEDQLTPTMEDSITEERVVRGDGSIQRKLSKLLEGKEEEWTAVAKKKGPLQLLDLPMDILKEIIKEVTHTNDLTALALTHSALHNLAIPHIYSRFDIVWPDATSTTDSRTGVDALTYGLATLVMGHDVFADSTNGQQSCAHPQSIRCTNCGTRNVLAGREGGQRRLGNQYPQFTRKFSLGNGPSDWVQEYMISKESGKMLGTLVALAVARMTNLETFIWDMPTGVLRDVWLALSSLQGKSLPGECRLERVLVRWHDNSAVEPGQTPPASSTVNATILTPHNSAFLSTLTDVGLQVPTGSLPAVQIGNQINQTTTSADATTRVEYPTLSVLPPLKSLSVLDIDELAYLDEMSILIDRSKDRLRELRVGISKKAQNKVFVYAWDGPELKQVDHDAKWPGAPNAIGEMRLGGVLGILLGRVFDIRKKSKIASRPKVDASNPIAGPAAQSLPDIASSETVDFFDFHSHADLSLDPALFQPLTDQAAVAGSPVLPPIVPLSIDTTVENAAGTAPSSDEDGSFPPMSPESEPVQPQHLHHLTSVFVQPRLPEKVTKPAPPARTPSKERPILDGRLRLQILELERVPLSIHVLQKAFDWTMITSLTILDCAYHENLWRMLRRQFQPQFPSKSALATSSTIRHRVSSGSSTKPIPSVPLEYQLSLKKIHTDFATPALIAFLKETLAPNTLEVLFLQDRRKNSASTVSINDIYRGPLRRHRKSLKKLLIDSSDKIPKGPALSNESTRWRTWMLNHEVLAYITSGNMSNLRELSVAIEYKDWHFFLRRLPQVPTLRSLNIPFIADHVTTNYDPRELALQIVDMIFLRPEVELCYLGISNKCFEILENRLNDEPTPSAEISASGETSAGDQFMTDSEDEEELAGDGSEEEDDDDDDDDEEAEPDETATEAVEANGLEYEPSESGDSEAESLDGSDDDRSKFSLRLREILFYDDKVAIFKARHMRL